MDLKMEPFQENKDKDINIKKEEYEDMDIVEYSHKNENLTDCINEFHIEKIKEEDEDINAIQEENNYQDVTIKEEEINFMEYNVEKRPNEVREENEDDIIYRLGLKPFNSLTFNEKKILIDNEKPTPKINLTKANKAFTRKFNLDLYKSVSWLCGSTSANKLYCWPCVLFSKERSVWTEVHKGYGDLNNINTAMSRHEKSVSHIQAYFDFKQFGKTKLNPKVNKQKESLITKHNEKVLKNREILKRLIRITCLLGMQELGFCNYEGSDSCENRGNYIELAYFLAEFDEKLENHLKTETVSKGFLSKTIHNDIINSVSTVLLNAIKNELSECTYIAILLDETSDVSCFSHLSTIVRYVDKNGNICERFLGFTDVSDGRSVDDIFKLIIKHLDELGCTKKLIAQSYDGAAVMSSEVDCVQEKIKEVAPEAMFIHCYEPELNVILSQAVSHIPKCNTFFSLLTSLSSFFSSSTKPTSVFDDFVRKRFPKLATTKWNYSSKLVETVKENMENLKNLFDYIQENPNIFDDRTKNEARGCSVALNSFDTNFLLEVFSIIYPHTDSLFNVLQTKIRDIKFCLTCVENTLSKIRDIREKEFDNIWETTVENCGLPSSRKRGDVSVETNYRKIYFELFDNILKQLKFRFRSLKNLKFIELLNFKKSKYYEVGFPEKAFQSLKNSYGAYFDLVRLKSELTVMYSHSTFPQDDIHKLLKYIILNNIKEVFPEVHSLLSLILTLPITPSSVEGSFSALKRIKTYLTNSQQQERLSNLSLMSIEKSFLKKQMENRNHFYDKVTEEFCIKSRKEEFQFK